MYVSIRCLQVESTTVSPSTPSDTRNVLYSTTKPLLQRRHRPPQALLRTLHAGIGRPRPCYGHCTPPSHVECDPTGSLAIDSIDSNNRSPQPV